jgi:hypothetical protein
LITVDVIGVLVIPIVVGFIVVVIVEAVKAPIRRYLRRRAGREKPRKKIEIATTESDKVSPPREKRKNNFETQPSQRRGVEDLFRFKVERPKERMKKERKAMEIKETIKVKPGCHETKTLRLKKGSEVGGLAEEVFGQDFSLYVVDKEGYSDFLNSESFHTLFEMEDLVATSFDIRIPESGKWYFVFDAYRKQLSREIEFECTVV